VRSVDRDVLPLHRQVTRDGERRRAELGSNEHRTGRRAVDRALERRGVDGLGHRHNVRHGVGDVQPAMSPAREKQVRAKRVGAERVGLEPGAAPARQRERRPTVDGEDALRRSRHVHEERDLVDLLGVRETDGHALPDDREVQTCRLDMIGAPPICERRTRRARPAQMGGALQRTRGIDSLEADRRVARVRRTQADERDERKGQEREPSPPPLGAYVVGQRSPAHRLENGRREPNALPLDRVGAAPPPPSVRRASPDGTCTRPPVPGRRVHVASF
jgi:hypothetical protein